MDYLQSVWEAEKKRYISLWRSQRQHESIFAGHLVFLEAVTTPQPAMHPFLEWQERNRIERHLFQQRRLNNRLNGQLLEALHGQLQAQNLYNQYLQQVRGLVWQLGQANANGMMLRHHLELNKLQSDQRAAVVTAALKMIQQIIQQLLNKMN